MPSLLRVLLACLLPGLCVGCVLAPESYFESGARPIERLDYAGWDALLRAHVREGVVDYPAFAASPEFAAFLATLRGSRATRETTREQRMAFWINAYNACAIAGIVDGGSPATLLGRAHFFLRTRCAVGAERITLWDLEHHRLRPLGDARIHFAIVCASASCPPLGSEAYVPERLDAQLEAAARSFVNDPTRNRFDAAGRKAWLSAIFDWYAEDFEADAGSVAASVARYADDPAVARGLTEGGWRLRFLDYDWSLNGTPPGR